jgi:hypothetical protein
MVWIWQHRLAAIFEIGGLAACYGSPMREPAAPPLPSNQGDWTHIYCHMQGHVQQDGRGHFLTDREGGIQIWEGQPVPAGARIGRVGMTGRTNGPHLHWGLKYKGEWTDPAFVLRAMYASQRAAL